MHFNTRYLKSFFCEHRCIISNDRASRGHYSSFFFLSDEDQAFFLNACRNERNRERKARRRERVICKMESGDAEIGMNNGRRAVWVVRLSAGTKHERESALGPARKDEEEAAGGYNR